MVGKNWKNLFMVIKIKRQKLSKKDLRQIVANFKRKLIEEQIPARNVFLFGSYATGKQHVDSDIDVAVVLPAKISSAARANARDLYWMAKSVYVRLEPHILSKAEFNNRWLSLPAEIKKTGIRV